MIFARIGDGPCYYHWNEIFAGVGGQCPHPHGSDSPENGCGIYGREVMKSLPLPFLLLFAVLFFLMVQLITFEAFLSSLVPLLFFFPAHSLRLVAASNSTARSHLSNFTCRAFCVSCRFLKQMIWESIFFSNCCHLYFLAVSALIAQADLV